MDCGTRRNCRGVLGVCFRHCVLHFGYCRPGGSSSYDSEPLFPNTVAVIDIDSTIQYDGTTNSPDGLKQQLDVAADDSRIIAVVLRVNSGGGVATAGEEMSIYVKEFREDTGKPVVVSSASTNASAAYEISSQADYIFTAHTTAIGAIGTAMQLVDYSGLMSMLGISTEDITSAESKDSTYGTRKSLPMKSGRITRLR